MPASGLPEPLAARGAHLDAALVVLQARDDRCDRLDRDLERGPVVASGADVEQHEDGRAPPALVLADHQALMPSGRLPVHAAQVVARRVLAQHEELAGDVEPAHDATIVGVEILAAAFGKRHHVVDAWLHDHLVEARGAPRAARQAERVADRRAQRADLEAAAPFGRDAVRGARRRARCERGEEEARVAAAAVEGVGEREHRRRRAAPAT